MAWGTNIAGGAATVKKQRNPYTAGQQQGAVGSAVLSGQPTPAQVTANNAAANAGAAAGWQGDMGLPDPNQARAANGAANAGAAAGWMGGDAYGGGPVPGQNGADVGFAGLFAGPGAGEQWAKDHAGEFEKASNMETLYGTGLSDRLMDSRSAGLSDVGPGAYSGWVATNQNAFAAPGQRESLYGEVGAGLTGQNFAAGAMRSIGTPTLDANRRVFEDAEGTLGQPGSLNERFDEMGDAFNDPGATEGIYDLYGGDPLKNKSYSETLYESGIERLNPYYDYAQKKAIDQAQRGTAARGGFNSGLAAEGERDITLKLRGEQALAQERLAPIADQERRARYDQGFDYAGRRDQENRDRVNAAFDLAGMDQDAEENRFKTRGELARGADESGEAQGRLSIDAARAESDAAAAADASAVNRARARGDLAAGADESARNRVLDTADMIYRGDELELDRAGENRLRAGQGDEEERARIRDIYGYAGDTDDARMERLGAGAQNATNQQALGEGRIKDMINGMAGQDEREAKLLTSIYNDMSSVDEIDEQWIQATAEKYGIDLAQMRDIAGAFGKVLGAGGDVVKALA